VRDEAIDQRGVDAVVHGVEEAVAAGGEVAGDCGARGWLLRAWVREATSTIGSEGI